MSDDLDSLRARQKALEDLEATASGVNDELHKAEQRLPKLQAAVEQLLSTAEETLSAIRQAAEAAEPKNEWMA